MAIGINLRKIHLKPRGKNSKVAYQWHCLMHRLAPTWWLRQRYQELLQSLETRTDKDYIFNRVAYYCKLTEQTHIDGHYVIGLMHTNLGGARNYYRDFFEYSRFFNPSLKVDCAFYDNIEIPMTASILKSRPIGNNNVNCVVCNLDKVRHFIFIKDKYSYEAKKNKAIFRGAAQQPHRKQNTAFQRHFCGLVIFV